MEGKEMYVDKYDCYLLTVRNTRNMDIEDRDF